MTSTIHSECRSLRSRALAASTVLLVALAVGACAPMTPPGSPGVSGDAAPAAAAATFEPAEAVTSTAPNPAAARYVMPGMLQSSPAIGSIVVTNPVAPRTIDLTQRPDDIWDRIRTGFAIPNIDTPLVAEQQAWYLAHPDYLRRAVDRSSRYLFHIVEQLNKRGMPTELALLPFVESAFNPLAYSKAQASGMWQFIPGTGRTYNLKQDWWRDERRDVIASTDAALTYLQTIYEMHGDWHLALASYNWGEGSVKRAIDRNAAAGLPTDYLNLSMPDETRNYVPKLQALKNIVANPEAFGVTLPRIVNEPYFVAVSRDRDIDVVTAAKLANMSVEDFRALNPSYNRPVIRAGANTALLVPADRADEFRNGLATRAPLATWQAHTVKRRETIERIAALYGMTPAALRQVNGLPARVQVRPGQALLVQKSGEGDVNLRFASFVPPTDVGLFAPSTASTYQVRRGDTLASIAKHFGMSVASLRAMNRLNTGQVAVGHRLQVQRPEGAPSLIKVKAGGAQAPGAVTPVHGMHGARAASVAKPPKGTTKATTKSAVAKGATVRSRPAATSHAAPATVQRSHAKRAR